MADDGAAGSAVSTPSEQQQQQSNNHEQQGARTLEQSLQAVLGIQENQQRTYTGSGLVTARATEADYEHAVEQGQLAVQSQLHFTYPESQSILQRARSKLFLTPPSKQIPQAGALPSPQSDNEHTKGRRSRGRSLFDRFSPCSSPKGVSPAGAPSPSKAANSADKAAARSRSPSQHVEIAFGRRWPERSRPKAAPAAASSSPSSKRASTTDSAEPSSPAPTQPERTSTMDRLKHFMSPNKHRSSSGERTACLASPQRSSYDSAAAAAMAAAAAASPAGARAAAATVAALELQASMPSVVDSLESTGSPRPLSPARQPEECDSPLLSHKLYQQQVHRHADSPLQQTPSTGSTLSAVQEGSSSGAVPAGWGPLDAAAATSAGASPAAGPEHGPGHTLPKQLAVTPEHAPAGVARSLQGATLEDALLQTPAIGSGTSPAAAQGHMGLRQQQQASTPLQGTPYYDCVSESSPGMATGSSSEAWVDSAECARAVLMASCPANFFAPRNGIGRSPASSAAGIYQSPPAAVTAAAYAAELSAAATAASNDAPGGPMTPLTECGSGSPHSMAACEVFLTPVAAAPAAQPAALSTGSPVRRRADSEALPEDLCSDLSTCDTDMEQYHPMSPGTAYEQQYGLPAPWAECGPVQDPHSSSTVVNWDSLGTGQHNSAASSAASSPRPGLRPLHLSMGGVQPQGSGSSTPRGPSNSARGPSNLGDRPSAEGTDRLSIYSAAAGAAARRAAGTEAGVGRSTDAADAEAAAHYGSSLRQVDATGQHGELFVLPPQAGLAHAAPESPSVEAARQILAAKAAVVQAAAGALEAARHVRGSPSPAAGRSPSSSWHLGSLQQDLGGVAVAANGESDAAAAAGELLYPASRAVDSHSFGSLVQRDETDAPSAAAPAQAPSEGPPASPAAVAVGQGNAEAAAAAAHACAGDAAAGAVPAGMVGSVQEGGAIEDQLQGERPVLSLPGVDVRVYSSSDEGFVSVFSSAGGHSDSSISLGLPPVYARAAPRGSSRLQPVEQQQGPGTERQQEGVRLHADRDTLDLPDGLSSLGSEADSQEGDEPSDSLQQPHTHHSSGEAAAALYGPSAASVAAPSWQHRPSLGLMGAGESTGTGHFLSCSSGDDSATAVSPGGSLPADAAADVAGAAASSGGGQVCLPSCCRPSLELPTRASGPRSFSNAEEGLRVFEGEQYPQQPHDSTSLGQQPGMPDSSTAAEAAGSPGGAGGEVRPAAVRSSEVAVLDLDDGQQQQQGHQQYQEGYQQEQQHALIGRPMSAAEQVAAAVAATTAGNTAAAMVCATFSSLMRSVLLVQPALREAAAAAEQQELQDQQLLWQEGSGMSAMSAATEGSEQCVGQVEAQEQQQCLQTLAADTVPDAEWLAEASATGGSSWVTVGEEESVPQLQVQLQDQPGLHRQETDQVPEEALFAQASAAAAESSWGAVEEEESAPQLQVQQQDQPGLHRQGTDQVPEEALFSQVSAAAAESSCGVVEEESVPQLHVQQQDQPGLHRQGTDQIPEEALFAQVSSAAAESSSGVIQEEESVPQLQVQQQEQPGLHRLGQDDAGAEQGTLLGQLWAQATAVAGSSSADTADEHSLPQVQQQQPAAPEAQQALEQHADAFMQQWHAQQQRSLSESIMVAARTSVDSAAKPAAATVHPGEIASLEGPAALSAAEANAQPGLQSVPAVAGQDQASAGQHQQLLQLHAGSDVGASEGCSASEAFYSVSEASGAALASEGTAASLAGGDSSLGQAAGSFDGPAAAVGGVEAEGSTTSAGQPTDSSSNTLDADSVANAVSIAAAGGEEAAPSSSAGGAALAATIAPELLDEAAAAEPQQQQDQQHQPATEVAAEPQLELQSPQGGGTAQQEQQQPAASVKDQQQLEQLQSTAVLEEALLQQPEQHEPAVVLLEQPLQQQDQQQPAPAAPQQEEQATAAALNQQQQEQELQAAAASVDQPQQVDALTLGLEAQVCMPDGTPGVLGTAAAVSQVQEGAGEEGTLQTCSNTAAGSQQYSLPETLDSPPACSSSGGARSSADAVAAFSMCDEDQTAAVGQPLAGADSAEDAAVVADAAAAVGARATAAAADGAQLPVVAANRGSWGSGAEYTPTSTAAGSELQTEGEAAVVAAWGHPAAAAGPGIAVEGASEAAASPSGAVDAAVAGQAAVGAGDAAAVGVGLVEQPIEQQADGALPAVNTLQHGPRSARGEAAAAGEDTSAASAAAAAAREETAAGSEAAASVKTAAASAAAAAAKKTAAAAAGEEISPMAATAAGGPTPEALADGEEATSSAAAALAAGRAAASSPIGRAKQYSKSFLKRLRKQAHKAAPAAAAAATADAAAGAAATEAVLAEEAAETAAAAGEAGGAAESGTAAVALAAGAAGTNSAHNPAVAVVDSSGPAGAGRATAAAPDATAASTGVGETVPAEAPADEAATTATVAAAAAIAEAAGVATAPAAAAGAACAQGAVSTSVSDTAALVAPTEAQTAAAEAAAAGAADEQQDGSDHLQPPSELPTTELPATEPPTTELPTSKLTATELPATELPASPDTKARLRVIDGMFQLSGLMLNDTVAAAAAAATAETSSTFAAAAATDRDNASTATAATAGMAATVVAAAEVSHAAATGAAAAEADNAPRVGAVTAAGENGESGDALAAAAAAAAAGETAVDAAEADGAAAECEQGSGEEQPAASPAAAVVAAEASVDAEASEAAAAAAAEASVGSDTSAAAEASEVNAGYASPAVPGGSLEGTAAAMQVADAATGDETAGEAAAALGRTVVAAGEQEVADSSEQPLAPAVADRDSWGSCDDTAAAEAAGESQLLVEAEGQAAAAWDHTHAAASSEAGDAAGVSSVGASSAEGTAAEHMLAEAAAAGVGRQGGEDGSFSAAAAEPAAKGLSYASALRRPPSRGPAAPVSPEVRAPAVDATEPASAAADRQDSVAPPVGQQQDSAPAEGAATLAPAASATAGAAGDVGEAEQAPAADADSASASKQLAVELPEGLPEPVADSDTATAALTALAANSNATAAAAVVSAAASPAGSALQPLSYAAAAAAAAAAAGAAAASAGSCSPKSPRRLPQPGPPAGRKDKTLVVQHSNTGATEEPGSPWAIRAATSQSGLQSATSSAAGSSRFSTPGVGNSSDGGSSTGAGLSSSGAGAFEGSSSGHTAGPSRSWELFQVAAAPAGRLAAAAIPASTDAHTGAGTALAESGSGPGGLSQHARHLLYGQFSSDGGTLLAAAAAAQGSRTAGTGKPGNDSASTTTGSVDGSHAELLSLSGAAAAAAAAAAAVSAAAAAGSTIAAEAGVQLAEAGGDHSRPTARRSASSGSASCTAGSIDTSGDSSVTGTVGDEVSSAVAAAAASGEGRIGEEERSTQQAQRRKKQKRKSTGAGAGPAAAVQQAAVEIAEEAIAAAARGNQPRLPSSAAAAATAQAAPAAGAVTGSSSGRSGKRRAHAAGRSWGVGLLLAILALVLTGGALLCVSPAGFTCSPSSFLPQHHQHDSPSTGITAWQRAQRTYQSMEAAAAATQQAAFRAIVDGTATAAARSERLWEQTQSSVSAAIAAAAASQQAAFQSVVDGAASAAVRSELLWNKAHSSVSAASAAAAAKPQHLLQRAHTARGTTTIALQQVWQQTHDGAAASAAAVAVKSQQLLQHAHTATHTKMHALQRVLQQTHDGAAAATSVAVANSWQLLQQARTAVSAKTAAAASRVQQAWQQTHDSAAAAATAAAARSWQLRQKATGSVAATTAAATAESQRLWHQARVSAATAGAAVQQAPAAVWLKLQSALQPAGQGLAGWYSQLRQQQHEVHRISSPAAATPAEAAGEGRSAASLRHQQQESLAQELQQLLQQQQQELAMHEAAEAAGMRRTLHELEARVRRMQERRAAQAVAASPSHTRASAQGGPSPNVQPQQQQHSLGGGSERDAEGSGSSGSVVSVLRELLEDNRAVLDAADQQLQHEMTVLLARFQTDMQRWHDSQAAAAAAAAASVAAGSVQDGDGAALAADTGDVVGDQQDQQVLEAAAAAVAAGAGGRVSEQQEQQLQQAAAAVQECSAAAEAAGAGGVVSEQQMQEAAAATEAAAAAAAEAAVQELVHKLVTQQVEREPDTDLISFLQQQQQQEEVQQDGVHGATAAAEAEADDSYAASDAPLVHDYDDYVEGQGQAYSSPAVQEDLAAAAAPAAGEAGGAAEGGVDVLLQLARTLHVDTEADGQLIAFLEGHRQRQARQQDLAQQQQGKARQQQQESGEVAEGQATAGDYEPLVHGYYDHYGDSLVQLDQQQETQQQGKQQEVGAVLEAAVQPVESERVGAPAEQEGEEKQPSGPGAAAVGDGNGGAELSSQQQQQDVLGPAVQPTAPEGVGAPVEHEGEGLQLSKPGAAADGDGNGTAVPSVQLAPQRQQQQDVPEQTVQATAPEGLPAPAARQGEGLLPSGPGTLWGWLMRRTPAAADGDGHAEVGPVQQQQHVLQPAVPPEAPEEVSVCLEQQGEGLLSSAPSATVLDHAEEQCPTAPTAQQIQQQEQQVAEGGDSPAANMSPAVEAVTSSSKPDAAAVAQQAAGSGASALQLDGTQLAQASGKSVSTAAATGQADASKAGPFGSSSWWADWPTAAVAVTTVGVLCAAAAGIALLLSATRQAAGDALGPDTPFMQLQQQSHDSAWDSDGGDAGEWADADLSMDGVYGMEHGGGEIQPFAGYGEDGASPWSDDGEDDASYEPSSGTEAGGDSPFSYDFSEGDLDAEAGGGSPAASGSPQQRSSSFAGFQPFPSSPLAGVGSAAAAAAGATGTAVAAAARGVRRYATRSTGGATEFLWLRPNNMVPRNVRGSPGGVEGVSPRRDGGINQRWLRNRVVTSIAGTAAHNPEIVDLVQSQAAVAYSSPGQQRRLSTGGTFAGSPGQQQQQHSGQSPHQQGYDRRPQSASRGDRGGGSAAAAAAGGNSSDMTPGRPPSPGSLQYSAGRSAHSPARPGQAVPRLERGGSVAAGASPLKSPRGLRDDRADVVLGA